MAGVLWTPSQKVRLSTAARPPPGMRILERFAVLPSARSPRLLVPLASRRTAAAALRQYNAGMSVPARVARAAAGFAMSIGAGQAAFRGRLYVFIAIDATTEAIDERTLIGHLRQALGRTDLHAAVRLGPARPNRKPVLQLITSGGEAFGYAKVGWNELTRQLVRDEGAALARFVGRSPRSFSVPGLIYAGPWSDAEVLVVTPLPNRLWGGGRPDELPMAATREVALADGVERQPLTGSPYWRGVRRRIAELALTGPRLIEARARTVADRVEEGHGKREIDFGAWHGDWAPWNMARFGDRLFVWDWERSGGPVPLGFDVLHFAYQVALHVTDLSPTAAAQDARVRSAQALVSLGVARDTFDVLASMYLLELFLRLHDARVRGGIAEERLYAGVLEAAERASAR